MTDADHTVVAKQCTKCGETKPVDLFPADRRVCKRCRAKQKRESRVAREASCPDVRERRLAKAREYIEANRSQVEAYKAGWRIQNSDKLKQYHAERYQRNKDEVRQRASDWKKANPEKRLANNRRWAAENPEKASACYRRNKAKRLACPTRSLHERMRALVAQSLRERGFPKRGKTCEILGCEWEFFKAHIERQFVKGMNWGNRSKWHIDHIVPLASAKTEEDVIRLNHFTNLRPMWAKDNIAKGDRITHLI